VIVGLDVANAAVIVLKLTLNDKIVVVKRRQTKLTVVVAGSLAIKRDLEILVAGLSDRYVIGVEFQRVSPWFRALIRRWAEQRRSAQVYFTHPLVPLLPTHRQPQCQDT